MGGIEMANSKSIAGLLGPSIIAITISETVNIHIWAGNTAAGVHFNGALLFIAGLAIVRAHNLWVRGWLVLVTLTGWFLMLLGLFRMFFPELQLEGAKHTSTRERADDVGSCVWHFLDFQSLSSGIIGSVSCFLDRPDYLPKGSTGERGQFE
jgi:hypothetical protein